MVLQDLLFSLISNHVYMDLEKNVKVQYLKLLEFNIFSFKGEIIWFSSHILISCLLNWLANADWMRKVNLHSYDMWEQSCWPVQVKWKQQEAINNQNFYTSY